jgi:hypothetical protein
MPMFERLQKPFLTVETGEAYQPIRLTYPLHQDSQDKLISTLAQLACLERKPNTNTWSWYWREECNDLHFESLDSYQKNTQRPVRLGTLTIRDNTLYINLPSFKRACLAAPFFHRLIDPSISTIQKADFLNKVFGLDERLPHGFSELFKEEVLEQIVMQRVQDYEKVQERVEHAASAEEALTILNEYTQSEGQKRLPYAERYAFTINEGQDTEVIFLAFYIFLRGRELVAIRRWFGETGYSLADAAEETVQQVFGQMDIDIIE